MEEAGRAPEAGAARSDGVVPAAAPLPISLTASCYYAMALCHLSQLAPIGSGPNAAVVWYAAALVVQVGLAVVTLWLVLLVARRRSRWPG